MGGSLSYHPFYSRIFHSKPSSYWGSRFAPPSSRTMFMNWKASLDRFTSESKMRKWGGTSKQGISHETLVWKLGEAKIQKSNKKPVVRCCNWLNSKITIFKNPGWGKHPTSPIWMLRMPAFGCQMPKSRVTHAAATQQPRRENVVRSDYSETPPGALKSWKGVPKSQLKGLDDLENKQFLTGTGLGSMTNPFSWRKKTWEPMIS